MVLVIGIDLAGSERRDTGFCVITGRTAHVMVVHTDTEILARIKALRGKKFIGIDAPLSLPHGRKNLERKSGVHFRRCDIALRERGIRFFPITLGPMRMLTKRGIALKRKILRMERHARVFEVYPGATYDSFHIQRKDRKAIMHWAKKYVRLISRDYSQDELDAVAAAITIKLYLKGKGMALGDGNEGQIIIPSNKRKLSAPGLG